MQPFELFSYLESMPHKDFKTAGDDVQYMIRIFEDEKKIRLIFEHTTSNTDNKNNFNVLIKKYKRENQSLYFSKGWAEAYYSCNEEIMSELISFMKSHSDFIVEICGWSYGGAMSVLAAEDLFFKTGIKPYVVTFGSPKVIVGNKTKNHILNCCADVKQYANINDPIPYLPPFLWSKHLNKVRLGKWDWLKPLNFNKYHFCYKNAEIYENAD